MSATRGKPDIGLHYLLSFGSINESFVLLPSSPLLYGFPSYDYSSLFFLFPSGPLNLPRLSETPYLFSMRNTELRLLNPLTFQMSSIECPLLYIATMVFSLSALLMLFSLDGWFMFCFSWMICAEAFRNAAHSSGSAPNSSNTSAAWFQGTGRHDCQPCHEWR